MFRFQACLLKSETSFDFHSFPETAARFHELREAPEGGFLLVNDYAITQLPVTVSPGKSNGWNDIWRMESGGGTEASYVRHSFDGRRYVKKERIGAEKAPEGRPPCRRGCLREGQGARTAQLNGCRFQDEAGPCFLA